MKTVNKQHSTTTRLSLLCVFLVCLVTCLLTSSSFINATSSECRGPSAQNTSARRGVTATLSKAELEDIVESELLSLHQQVEGLGAEDLEYLAQLTEEHVQTFGFRRRFRRFARRIGRAIRRVGRVIGRVLRALNPFRLFKRRSHRIIMDSVANFNGFTGPNQESLETRREFIGGGVQNARPVASVAAAAVLRRRRGRRFLGRAFRKFGRAAGRFGRAAFRAAKRAHFGVRGTVRAFKRLGKSALRKINEQSLKRGGKIGKFVRGISRHFANQSMKKKMEALEQRSAGAASDGKPVNCVACRVDCTKAYSTLGGSMFASCGKQYYYYGCRAVAPCFQTTTATDDEIEGMVGICVYRNGCKFTNAWRDAGNNQLVTDRLVGRIRGSGQNPE